MRIRDWSSDLCSSDLGEGVSDRGRHGCGARTPVRRAQPARHVRSARTRALLDDSDQRESFCRASATGAARGTRIDRAAQERRPAAARQDRCDDRSERAERDLADRARSEEQTSELQSLMRISYAVFCLKKKKMNLLDIYTTNFISVPSCISTL